MRPATRPVRSPYRQIPYTPCRLSSTQPPTPRPYKQASPEERVSRHPLDPKEPKPEPKKGVGFYLWPFRRRNQAHIKTEEPPDLARGIEASKRFVKEGVLDPKYHAAARKVTALICALPIAIYLGWVLFRRRFQGVEQKRFPKVRRQEELR